jgi:hypothetical protein
VNAVAIWELVWKWSLSLGSGSLDELNEDSRCSTLEVFRAKGLVSSEQGSVV